MKTEISSIILRKIQLADCQLISHAFGQQGWDKPVSQYERYFELQETGQRDIMLAEYQNEFAGYLTINWQPGYGPFKERNIPEVVDFNVLKKYQRLGIGTVLMDEAERRIKQVSDYAGIGFGVMKDYGAAQILYIKRGYIPDGKGLMKDTKSLDYGDKIVVDHSLAFYLIKTLK